MLKNNIKSCVEAVNICFTKSSSLVAIPVIPFPPLFWLLSTIMSKSIWGVQQGYTGGGLLLYAVEYGFLPFILITLFSFKICYDTSNKIASIAFDILIIKVIMYL